MMQVRYDDRSRRLIVRCSFIENRHIAALARKRYVSAARHWVVPLLGDSARHFLELERSGIPISIDEDARGRMIAQIERRRIMRVPFPVGYEFKTEPFAHQRRGLDYVWGLPACALFMEQGTGKSKLAIDLNCARMMAGQIAVLVVFCPNSVRENWMQELRTHWPMPGVEFMVLRGKNPEATAARVALAGRAVLVVGYESIQHRLRSGKVFEELLACIVGRDYAVCVDESHWVKGHDANRSRNVEFVAAAASFRQIMTGTEVSNGLLDLYQQFQILDPDIIGSGSFYSFRARYAIMGGYEGRQVVGFQNVEELMDKIGPYAFQCRKAECLDLPEKVYTRRAVEMTPEQARIYRSLDDQMRAVVQSVSGEPVSVVLRMALQRYSALQQVTGGFLNYTESTEDAVIERQPQRLSSWVCEPSKNPKVREALAVILEDPGRKTIVWAKYRTEIAQLVAHLRAELGAHAVVEYHGGVTPEDRQVALDEFKTGRAIIFVANQFTGGTGLTINEASRVIYFSNTLRLVDRLQSEDRCHRIGQDRSVLYVDIVCEGTVDEDILRSLSDKLDVAEYVKAAMRA